MNDSHHTDVVDAVLEQHDAAKRGLAEVANATGSNRSDRFHELAGVLAAHEAAEESVIYPALRRLGDEGARVADARTSEEAAAEQTLWKLQGLDATSDEFGQLFDRFSAEVMEHATKEEAEVLPLLRSSFSDDERGSMGDAFVAAPASR